MKIRDSFVMQGNDRFDFNQSFFIHKYVFQRHVVGLTRRHKSY